MNAPQRIFFMVLFAAQLVVLPITTALASGNAESCQQSYNKNQPHCKKR